MKQAFTQTFLIASFSLLAVGIFAVPAMAQSPNLPDAAQNQGPPDHAVERREAAQNRSSNEERDSLRDEQCKQKQQTIDNVTALFNEKLEKHYDTMERVFTRVQTFHDDNQLTDPDYDELEGDVITSQEAARKQIDNVLQSPTRVNCDNDSIGATLQVYRLEAQDAIDTLKIYRSNLVLLIQSLRAEVADTNTESESSEQTEPTTTN